jgi:hypothetical protein
MAHRPVVCPAGASEPIPTGNGTPARTLQTHPAVGAEL